MSTAKTQSPLASPIDLGPRTMANRIVLAPMSVCYADTNGNVTPHMIEHYARRAAGGAAMVITENFAVSPSGRQLPRQALLTPESDVAALAALAEAIKREGALALVQIVHAGRYAGPWEHYERQRRLAPSPIEFELLPGRRVTPQEITVAEMDEAVASFATATRLARAAGFDGVEIHGGQGMLISSFQSPRMNQRTDGHGSDRNRFARDVVDAVVRQAGQDMLVGYHLFTDEKMEGGHTSAHAVAFARQLDSAGLHFLIPIPTTFESLRARRMAEPMVDPTAHSSEVAAELAAATSIPVFANGGLGSREAAEAALAGGHVQAVALARAVFADPDWPRKTLSGAPVRSCACTPPTCLQTQLTGAVCQSWPQEIKDRGFWGTYDLQLTSVEGSP